MTDNNKNTRMMKWAYPLLLVLLLILGTAAGYFLNRPAPGAGEHHHCTDPHCTEHHHCTDPHCTEHAVGTPEK